MAVDPARAKSLFLAASDLSSLDRAAYLDRECGGDAELRARVEALLRANDAAPLPPAEPQDGTSSHFPDCQPQTEEHRDPTARIGSILAGKYKLVQEIGEGGMGSVFMAQQTEPVKRAVAVKVIKAGMDSKAVLARFEAERQALAMMDHPNIARVLDAGTTEGGRPFFVMELVKGTPITQYCDERKLTPRQRLELFVPVCNAIQHAHQKGIIHRDIKPSNVLIAMYDDRAVPKVIDFGVAKAAGQSLTEKTLMTGLGAVVGTPEYMSPEQASLNNLDIDTRSDVYALGVLLYELLTGSTPVDKKSLGKAAFLEILRIVREVEAPRPSAKLSTIDTLPSVAANRGTEPAKLSKLMKGELDWVVLKALEKDRARRYESANALSRDIQRYLADEVVEARPPSVSYRLKKFVRRHPLQLALAGTVALLLLGAGTVVWWQNEQASTRRETDLRRRLEDEQRSAADTARLARNAEAVAALLGQVEEALRAGDAAKASVALDAARKRSAEGGAAEQAVRLGRLDADLALSRGLDAIDQFRWTWTANKFADPAVVATRTREALRRFAADPDAMSPEDAAARVSASAVRERIVPALDRLWRQEQTVGVRAVLRRVDANPYRDAVRDAIVRNDRAKLNELANRADALEQPPGFATLLGESDYIDVVRRRQLLLAAVSRKAGRLDLLMAMYGTHATDSPDSATERIRWLQAAVAAAPANVAALNDLGTALQAKGERSEAMVFFRRALALDPTFAVAHNNIGTEQMKNDEVDEALRHFREAVALDPASSIMHFNLGNALAAKGQNDEAMASYQMAVALDTEHVSAYRMLGAALLRKGLWDEAILPLRKGGALDSTSTEDHMRMGLAFHKADRLDEAIRYFRKAVALDPKLARAHFYLGRVLGAKGQWDEAIANVRKAVALDPNDSEFHYGLGTMLSGRGRTDEAIACLQKAGALEPTRAEPHCNLGHALARQGRFAESLAAFKKGHELGLNQPEWFFPSAACVRQAEANVAMEAKFPAFLRGEFQPADTKERLGLAGVCMGKKLPNKAAGLYAAAFATNPALADDLEAGHRYIAAGCAALAASGQGEGAAKLDDRERTRLRQQALDWLRADLALNARRLESGEPADRAVAEWLLRGWQGDNEVAGVRDAAALAKLPAEEQQAFGRLWADVATLLKTVEAPASTVANAGKSDPIASAIENSLNRMKADHGPDHPATLKIMGNLSELYRDARNFELALPLLEELLKLRKASLGPEHPETLQSMHYLASVYSETGQIDRATALYEETLKLWKTRLGPDHNNTLIALSDLASTYWKAKRLDKSIPLYEEALKSWEAALGRDHLQTLRNVANLGVNYMDAGRLKEAIPLLEEAHQAARNHPQLRFVTGHLAEAYAKAGENAKRIKLSEDLGLRKETFDPDHPDTLKRMDELAQAYQEVGQIDRALPLFEETLKLRKARLGPDHRDTLSNLRSLAVAYWQGKQLDKSIPLFEETLKRQEARFGRNDPDTLRTVGNLGVNYCHAGRSKEGILLLEEAHRAAKQFPQLDRVVGSLLEAYRAAGEDAKFIRLGEEAFKLRKATLGPDHPDTLTIADGLASAYQNSGQLDRALPLFEETLKFRKARLGPDHRETLSSLSNLAVAYWHGKQLDRSIPLFEETLKRQEAKFGRDHPETLMTVGNLGVNYSHAGRLKEAIPLLEEVQRAARKYPDLRWVGGRLLEAYAKTGDDAKLAGMLPELLAETRQSLPKDSPQLAGQLAQFGSVLLENKKWVEAEPILRKSLALREKFEPDAWTTFNTQSLLGGALLGQKKYADAAPLLLAGYKGMKEREKTIPAQGSIRLPDALDRLIELYTATNKPDEVKKWQAERAKYPKLVAPAKETK